MNARASPTLTPPAGNPVLPLLRAVLLADLVDSTAFVQRFGDARAAVALRRLDLQIRDLLEFTGGRLIDKADGLLAIFERPIQAVDFALRYQQALRHFSAAEKAVLTARVGIHVGEVMTWANSPPAVAAGAKPLEVEGLAKPVAARLMALALPGQILLSSMAQSLAQRAEAELGDRAERVRWLVHGRYRFKGVPTPLLVHEVGETGFAPLRVPPSGHKVWREVPLWRRPPVLAFELLVFLAVGAFYGYGMLRSPPALAFNERDWVVVGDLSNFTGDPRFEQSLDSALRIGLEQSRFVNILPQLKVDSALQRMGRSDKATVDRAIGSEIALREGARALLLPSVAEVGGRLRVNVEVIDPNTQMTVYAESADGQGAGSVLASLDSINRKLRQNLGESMPDIQASDKPLALVTTGNLDALRAFSLGDAANRRGRYQEAWLFYERALSLDPQFAMAKLRMARIRAREGDLAGAEKLALAASQGRGRLTQREALELDSFIARFGSAAESLSKYRVWAATYPDAFPAYYGYALAGLNNNAYADALQFLSPALSPKNPARASAFFLQGALLLGLDRYAEARAAFQQSESMRVGSRKLEVAEAFAAERNYTDAARVLKGQKRSGLPGADLELSLDDPVLLIDQGRWPEAVRSLDALQLTAESASPTYAEALLGSRLLLQAGSGQLQRAQWRAFAARQDKRLASPTAAIRADAIFPLMAAGWLAARHGDLAEANRTLQASKDQITADAPETSLRAMLEAELALAGHQPKTAIAVLRARHDGTELYLSHTVLMRAFAADGNWPAAMAEADWLATRRGRAYVEFNYWDMFAAVNVAESNLALLDAAEFATRLGQSKLAQAKLTAFLRAWPHAETLAFLQPRLKALRAAPKSAGL
jgi:putative peptide modification system cyclase